MRLLLCLLLITCNRSTYSQIIPIEVKTEDGLEAMSIDFDLLKDQGVLKKVETDSMLDISKVQYLNIFGSKYVLKEVSEMVGLFRILIDGKISLYYDMRSNDFPYFILKEGELFPLKVEYRFTDGERTTIPVFAGTLNNLLSDCNVFRIGEFENSKYSEELFRDVISRYNLACGWEDEKYSSSLNLARNSDFNEFDFDEVIVNLKTGESFKTPIRTNSFLKDAEVRTNSFVLTEREVSSVILGERIYCIRKVGNETFALEKLTDGKLIYLKGLDSGGSVRMFVQKDDLIKELKVVKRVTSNGSIQTFEEYKAVLKILTNDCNSLLGGEIDKMRFEQKAVYNLIVRYNEICGLPSVQSEVSETLTDRVSEGEEQVIKPKGTFQIGFGVAGFLGVGRFVVDEYKQKIDFQEIGLGVRMPFKSGQTRSRWSTDFQLYAAHSFGNGKVKDTKYAGRLTERTTQYSETSLRGYISGYHSFLVKRGNYLMIGLGFGYEQRLIQSSMTKINVFGTFSNEIENEKWDNNIVSSGDIQVTPSLAFQSGKFRLTYHYFPINRMERTGKVTYQTRAIYGYRNQLCVTYFLK